MADKFLNMSLLCVKIFSGHNTYKHCKAFVEDVLLVSDEEILKAVSVLYGRGLVVEPSGMLITFIYAFFLSSFRPPLLVLISFTLFFMVQASGIEILRPPCQVDG